MPTTPSPTPKRVNFSPLPSPSFSRINGSPWPSSSRTKSNIRSLLPKLSFKKRSGISEIQKAAILALGGSPAATREKASIPRTLSFRKLFTPRVRHVSSLPVTPTAHSSPESMHGGANDPVNYDVSKLLDNFIQIHAIHFLCIVTIIIINLITSLCFIPFMSSINPCLITNPLKWVSR